MTVRLSHKINEFIDLEGEQFKIFEKIKSGGMGTVYKVLKIPTNTIYAVKECDILDDPRGKFMSRQQAVEIFHREGRHIERLKCPGMPAGFQQDFPQRNLRICLNCGKKVPDNLSSCKICQVNPGTIYYHPQIIDKRCYIFMDYIDGEDLDDLMKSFNYPLEHDNAAQLIDWMHNIGKTINCIHEKNFIYRDIKPQNIRISHSDGQVYLLDFGLVRMQSTSRSRSSQKTMTSNLGTDGYAPPEQISGTPCKQSDIYAMTMTLIELLSGLNPTTPVDRERIIKENPRSLFPFLSDESIDIIKNSLNLNPNSRPSAKEWIKAFERPFKSQSKPNLDKSKKTKILSPIQTQTKKRTPNLIYAFLFGSFLLIIIICSILIPDNSDKIFTAVSRQGTVIYASPDKKKIIERLKDGKKLELQDAGSDNYMFKIKSIDGTPAIGYISRERVDIYDE
ncbi:hypothetical protein GMMP15_90037 [Candidatus Magnetomoraceae bacterium gMMP-15]